MFGHKSENSLESALTSVPIEQRLTITGESPKPAANITVTEKITQQP